MLCYRSGKPCVRSGQWAGFWGRAPTLTSHHRIPEAPSQAPPWIRPISGTAVHSILSSAIRLCTTTANSWASCGEYPARRGTHRGSDPQESAPAVVPSTWRRHEEYVCQSKRKSTRWMKTGGLKVSFRVAECFRRRGNFLIPAALRYSETGVLTSASLHDRLTLSETPFR